jgi:hypothetical protein
METAFATELSSRMWSSKESHRIGSKQSDRIGLKFVSLQTVKLPGRISTVIHGIAVSRICGKD